jgi:outer membrane receptor protein involved in Fe transport
MFLLSAAAIVPFSGAFADVAFAQATPSPAPAPHPSSNQPSPPPASTPAAQPAPAPDQPAAAPDPSEQEIVVRAQVDQRTSIDRETYIVRDNAQARTSNALDILGRIPAVTVQPDNSVRLLGTTGVTVLVDGRPSPNPNVLRDLQGSEIARIEVVTNPSAQFSASGTGGIINIITRRDAAGGLRGSMTASVGRYGSYEARVAPTWSSGDWTVTGQSGRHSQRHRDGDDPRAHQPQPRPARSPTRSRRRRSNGARVRQREHADQLSASDKKTITLSGGLVSAEARNDIDADLLITPGPATPINLLTTTGFDYNGRNIALEYRAEGKRPAELLTTSLQQFSFSPNSSTRSNFNGRVFQSEISPMRVSASSSSTTSGRFNRVGGFWSAVRSTRGTISAGTSGAESCPSAELCR